MIGQVSARTSQRISTMNALIVRLARHIFACLRYRRDEALIGTIFVWLDDQDQADQDDLLTTQRSRDRSAWYYDQSALSSGKTDITARCAEHMPTLTRLFLLLRVPYAMQIDDIARTFEIRPRRVRRHLRRAVAILARDRH
jgi:DNA-directed RNA polymerase specialized sigma24 family protein